MEIFRTWGKIKIKKREKNRKITRQILKSQWLYSNDYEYLGIFFKKKQQLK